MLFVLSRGEFGGAERSTIAALRRRPDDIDAAVLLLSPGRDEHDLRSMGLRIVTLPSLPATSRGRARLIRLLDRNVAALAPDLIYATGNKAALASVFPAARRRIPLVWNKCDSWYDGHGASILARACRRVVVPSNACGAAIPANRRAVIDPSLPIAADNPSPPPLPRPPATIGSIGRLEPRKGHEDVILAAARIRDRIPDLRVLIAGPSVPYVPSHPDELRRIAEKHGLGDRVEFLGYVPGVEDVLSRLTVFVSASYRDHTGRGGEAFGLAIAEACWSGIPVVVTDSGGETEHVRHGVNGLVVPPREPAKLATAILELLEDPVKSARMGAQGAEMARRRFDAHRTAAALFTELQSCVRPVWMTG